MLEIHSIRKEHGGVHVTVFTDGRLVPWKPLSLNDWILYARDYNRGKIPDSHLEDEIFRKCVLDETMVRQMDFLAAGIVTSVVTHIWQHSGPADTATFRDDLNTARGIIGAQGIRAVHDLVRYITIAFPYKPEEVYELDYETFMLRVAQAEDKLLALGIIHGPIEIMTEEDKDKPAPQKPKKRIDAKKAWEQQQLQNKLATDETIQQQKRETAAVPRDRWWKTSPVLEAEKPVKVDFQTDGQRADSFLLDSHDMSEPPEMQQYLIDMKGKENRDKMMKEAQWIYKDLIAELEKKKNEGAK